MTIYDGFGREVDLERLREEQAAPTMSGIRNIYSAMHPAAGLTPERLGAILREAEFGDPFLYLELAEEMEEKDLHYLAVLSTRKEAVSQLDLEVTPASAQKDDVRAADMVRAMLSGDAIDIEDTMIDILDAIGKGFSATEIIWETSNREWFPRGLRWRDPRWFAFDWVSGAELLVRTLKEENSAGGSGAEGTARGSHFKGGGLYGALRGGAQPMTEPLLPYKFIVHIAKAKAGLPIRGGLARAAGWAYLFKNYVLKDWVTFAEVFGQPLRVGKYGAGATEQDKEKLLAAVSNLGTDAAAIIPDSMLIEFTEARQTGSAELYQSFCAYLDAQVSKAVLGQTLTTEIPQGAGSRAAAQVHDVVRGDIMRADARRLAATLNRDLVKPIVDLNLGPRKNYPQIALGVTDDADAADFVDMVTKLADHGLRIGQRSIMRRLNLPEPLEGEPLLAPSASPSGRDLSRGD
jgi:phage gp29-like protein